MPKKKGEEISEKRTANAFYKEIKRCYLLPEIHDPASLALPANVRRLSPLTITQPMETKSLYNHLLADYYLWLIIIYYEILIILQHVQFTCKIHSTHKFQNHRNFHYPTLNKKPSITHSLAGNNQPPNSSQSWLIRRAPITEHPSNFK